MRPIKSGRTVLGTRRAWEPPAMTTLAIGTETKSARDTWKSGGLETSGSAQPGFAQPPAPPATKLGFSFEWSFPLSARFDH